MNNLRWVTWFLLYLDQFAIVKVCHALFNSIMAPIALKSTVCIPIYFEQCLWSIIWITQGFSEACQSICDYANKRRKKYMGPPDADNGSTPLSFTGRFWHVKDSRRGTGGDIVIVDRGIMGSTFFSPPPQVARAFKREMRYGKASFTVCVPIYFSLRLFV